MTIMTIYHNPFVYILVHVKLVSKLATNTNQLLSKFYGDYCLMKVHLSIVELDTNSFVFSARNFRQLNVKITKIYKKKEGIHAVFNFLALSAPVQTYATPIERL